MAKKKYEDKKPRNRFKTGLFIYLLILALLLAGANFILWNLLEGYQARQDAEALEAAQLAEQKAHEKAGDPDELAVLELIPHPCARLVGRFAAMPLRIAEDDLDHDQ